jgi:pseudouridylate synthase
MHLINRASPKHVALETTLLLHGVPKGHGSHLARELSDIVTQAGAHPAIVGLYRGVPTVGLNEAELAELFAADRVEKANSSNLGILIHRRAHAATTVSTTMELAAAAGVRLFATGGLGGIHRGYGEHLDISADLAAFTRFPVAVVTSGVKSLLDVESTREALETLGIPVVGFRTDTFPAFYLRSSAARVDARFDDVPAIAQFITAELARTGRGIVIANPIPESDEIPAADWSRWISEAQSRASTARGRDATPAILKHLHEVSGGATLRANLALIRANTRLATEIAASL